MRINPLQFLTERQIKLLAQAEGLSVSQLLAKYERLQRKPSRSRKAPSKRRASTRGVSRGSTRLNPPQTEAQANAAKAMRLFRSGQADSLKEAWDMVRGGKPTRAEEKHFAHSQRAMALYHSGEAATLGEAWHMAGR